MSEKSECARAQNRREIILAENARLREADLRAENARLRESAELNADYHRREKKLQTEIASLALEESSAIKAENARLRAALEEINKADIARAALEVKP
jgi:hypothetical protein